MSLPLNEVFTRLDQDPHDREANRALHAHARDLASRLACRWRQDDDEREELLGHLLQRVHQRALAGDLPSVEAPAAWLATVARNLAVDLWWRARRRTVSSAVASEPAAPESAPELDPEDLAAFERQVVAHARAFREERYRDAFDQAWEDAVARLTRAERLVDRELARAGPPPEHTPPEAWRRAAADRVSQAQTRLRRELNEALGVLERSGLGRDDAELFRQVLARLGGRPLRRSPSVRVES